MAQKQHEFRDGVRITTLCAALSCAGLAMAAAPVLDPLQLEASVGWDDNLTRSGEAPSRLGDRLQAISVSRRATIPLAEHMQGVVDGFLSAEALARYEGLDRLSGGVTGQLQYRPSAAFGAPTFALVAGLQRDAYRSQQRSGTRFAVDATARQSWTDRIDASAAFGWSRRDATDGVFDQRERSLRAHIDYSLGRSGTIYAGAEQRRGDVVTTSFGYDPAYAGAARAVAPDAAFGPGYLAYRLEGRTMTWTLGWSLPLGNKRALDLAWRQARTSASIPTEAMHYRSTLFSLSYLMQF